MHLELIIYFSIVRMRHINNYYLMQNTLLCYYFPYKLTILMYTLYRVVKEAHILFSEIFWSYYVVVLGIFLIQGHYPQLPQRRIPSITPSSSWRPPA